MRGYVSTAFGCPYEGPVDPAQAARVCRDLLDLGCDEVSVGDTIGVAGTHGKTTTSAMLATILASATAGVSYVVGGELTGLGSGARWGDGEWFVVEADESDGTFLELPVEVAVVTSIEPDHLEYWGSFAALLEGFERFLTAAQRRVVCGDDEAAVRLTEHAVHIAAAAGDRDLAAYALVRRALISYYRGDATDTIALAEGAENRRLPPRIRGLAAQHLAQGHALRGDHRACMRRLDASRELLEQDCPDPTSGGPGGSAAGHSFEVNPPGQLDELIETP